MTTVTSSQLVSWRVIDNDSISSYSKEQIRLLLISPAFRRNNDHTTNIRTSSDNITALQECISLYCSVNDMFVYFIMFILLSVIIPRYMLSHIVHEFTKVEDEDGIKISGPDDILSILDV